MPRINFIGIGDIEVDKSTTIIEAARQLGIAIESPCNGAGVCGKCKVLLEKESAYVLACETHVLEDMSVFPPEKEKNHTLKILSGGKSFNIELNPNVEKQYVADITKIFGLSLDIGTTTLVLSLVDLNDGSEIDSISAMNPQAVYAQDVLSRIKFASSKEGLETMRSTLIAEVNKMLEILEERSNTSKENIYEAVFSGNTCMLHLAAGVEPAALGKYPYTSAIEGISVLKAADMGLDISKDGTVYLPPCISAYVGADITSGILATSLFELNGVTLFVDIGTNGEMVIGANGKLSAASTAAGPAFEGMNIAKGMRAGNGAVEEFEIADGEIRIKVIGNTKATGICGSGLIDIVGELVFHNVIGKNGKFCDAAQLPPFLAERLIEQNGKKAFQVEGDVVLTQKDIRQVQLAKGAIRAGIEYLLRAKNTPPEQVDRVLIAGSFGYHLRAKSLINIGLMPKEFEGKIEFVGNTSSSGGIAFLLGRQYRTEMEKRIKEIEVLELANMPDFEKLFVKTLNF
ncbi:ferredoxin [Fibrobacteria bacterium R8-3-H12]